MRFAKGSISWIITSLFIFIIISTITILFTTYNNFLTLLSLISLIITILLAIFFRDPERKIGKDIVSPADGYIRNIYELDDKDIGKSKVISIFMNIHNVHVNRMPIKGEIKDTIHLSGLHIPAFKKESEKNERFIIKIKSSIGLIKIVLIAGTIARRIVPYIKKKDILNKGEKIGIIRLGSRVDLYLPNLKNLLIEVNEGDKVKAGESCVAKIND